MQHFSPELQAILQHFRTGFAALDNHKAGPEVQQAYEYIAAHVRSAAPMAFAAGADLLEPLQRATIPLGEGASVDISSSEDGGLLMLYVVEASGKDAAVPVTSAAATEIRQALARVR